jgi:hypothetical protein
MTCNTVRLIVRRRETMCDVYPSQTISYHDPSTQNAAFLPCYPTHPEIVLANTEPKHIQDPTISPQTTSCLYNPLHSLPVKKPSLPATNSLQSLAISFKIDPASCVCLASMPNIMHLPIRDLTSESHRGLSTAVAEASFAGDEDVYRTFGSSVGVMCRRSAERAIRVRIVPS